MTFTHLMDCLVLTYAPIYTIFSVNELSSFESGNLFLKSMFNYLVFSFIKMFLFATVIPYEIKETAALSLPLEGVKFLINSLEIFFLFNLLKGNVSNESQIKNKILTVGLGWVCAESVFSYLFYFLMNAFGDEFSWEYIQTAIGANVEIIEKLAVATLVQISIIKKDRNSSFLHLLLLILGKYAFNQFGHLLFKKLDFEGNQWKILGAKGGVSVIFGCLSKIILNCNVSFDEENKKKTS